MPLRKGLTTIDRIMRRIFALVICCLLCALTAGAQQVRWNADYQAYIDRYKDIAMCKATVKESGSVKTRVSKPAASGVESLSIRT